MRVIEQIINEKGGWHNADCSYDKKKYFTDVREKFVGGVALWDFYQWKRIYCRHLMTGYSS